MCAGAVLPCSLFSSPVAVLGACHAVHIDDEGKMVANTAGAGSGEPPDDWYLNMIARAESLRRAMVVANSIEPVRLRINDTVAIEERHFNPIVWQSAFVPAAGALVRAGLCSVLPG
jgi:hypothetical protein